jgi:hypothetical protein
MKTTKMVTPKPMRVPRDMPAIAPAVKGFPFGGSGIGEEETDGDGVDAGDGAAVVDANEVFGEDIGVVESVVGSGSSEGVARADKADDAGRPRAVEDGLSSPMGLVGPVSSVGCSRAVFAVVRVGKVAREIGSSA